MLFNTTILPMKYRPFILFIVAFWGLQVSSVCGQSPENLREYDVQIAQLIGGKSIHKRYPKALPTLLQTLQKKTSISVAPYAAVITSFEDPNIFKYPFIYVNYADRAEWVFSENEKENLRRYLKNGGFLYIDAGINAAFLRGDKKFGQHHSFAAWEISPDVGKAFKSVFPTRTFTSLPRSHSIYKAYYKGLPDASQLPESVKEFVINEKWPDGTYSAVALKVDGRIAVLATPIIAMGWGKDELGNWRTYIQFRIRESEEGLSERLSTAAYTGDRYEVKREDQQVDTIFCQERALPAWVKEPDGQWRVFQYYGSREISDFAHKFYTQLGMNIIIYALTGGA
jgi:hypothetical protein